MEKKLENVKKGIELMEKFVKERRFVGKVFERFAEKFEFIEEMKRFFEKRYHRKFRKNIFFQQPNAIYEKKNYIEISKNIKFIVKKKKKKFLKFFPEKI